MYFRDYVFGLGRRWWVLLIGLALTIGGAFTANHTVPVQYGAESSMVLLPAKASLDDVANPYLQLGGLAQALEILSDRLEAAQLSATVTKSYPGASYTAVPDTNSSGPILIISTTARSGSSAVGLLDAVRSAASSELTQMQVELGVSEDSLIGITTVTTDDSATVDGKTRLQVTAAVAAVGVVLTVLIAAGVDRLILARRRTRAAAGPAEATDDEPTDDEATDETPDDAADVAGTDKDDADEPTDSEEDSLTDAEKKTSR